MSPGSIRPAPFILHVSAKATTFSVNGVRTGSLVDIYSLLTDGNRMIYPVMASGEAQTLITIARAGDCLILEAQMLPLLFSCALISSRC